MQAVLGKPKFERNSSTIQILRACYANGYIRGDAYEVRRTVHVRLLTIHTTIQGLEVEVD